MSLFKQKDPQDDRRFQLLRDQHGRLWGATIELATGDPTGPIDLLDENRRDERGNHYHKKAPPVMPPAPFLKVNSKRAHGVLTIDYTGWKASRRKALEEFDRRVLGIAQQMYKDGALRAIEEREPALFALAGIPPERVEPIEAAEYGDPWALGLTDVRPDWADLYMAPEHVIVKRAERKGRPAFLDYKKGAGPETPGRAEATEAQVTDESYPLFVKSAGRGVQRWKLSNGKEVRGTKDEARDAEARLANVHESWE